MEDDQVLDAIKKLDARRLHEEPHEENTIKYPKEIYKGINGKEMTNPERLWGEGMNRRHSYDLGHEAGYAKCLADRSDPLAGYSNLTEAIKAGEPIDYEKLDGINVHCVNPDMETRRGRMEYNKTRPATRATSWLCENVNNLYAMAFVGGWSGVEGWTLWLEGEIPLRRKTADQLKVGTYFRGELRGNISTDLMCVGRPIDFDGKTVHHTPTMRESSSSPDEWVVLEEYGPFPFPDTQ